jgi:uncharacterized protein (TIGR00730 family)
MTIGSLCVFCGSSIRVDEAYRDAAARLGAAIAEQGITLVYGGGKIGLMGVLADAALGAGGRVIGVIPGFLRDLEVAHAGLTELRIVESMHDRKRVMFELADAFVVLPGGFGTLDETIEVVTWRQLGLHDKPVVLVDVNGFWAPLRSLIAAVVGAGFAHPEHADLFATAQTVDGVFTALRDAPPTRVNADAKWT